MGFAVLIAGDSFVRLQGFQISGIPLSGGFLEISLLMPFSLDFAGIPCFD
jgi:hypothetical protein